MNSSNRIIADGADRPKILALGDPASAAYDSQAHAIVELGDILHMHESGFKNADDALHFIQIHRIDIVLFPNPYGNKRRLRIYLRCREVGIPVIVFDRGGLPDSWFFDIGFNADSPTYSPSQWDAPIDEQQPAIEKYIDETRQSGGSLERQGVKLGGQALRDRLGLKGKKCLFVPFQRPSDTTILHFSGNVKNVPDFTAKIESLQLKLESLSDEWIILCKKHPLETSIPSQKLRFVPNDTHVNDLLEMCDAVCLVNSGVGLLATLYEKPVFYFGEVYYGHPRLNRMVETVGDVVRGLSKDPVIFSKETRNRLIHHLINNVYSSVKFTTELIRQKDGALRNITRHIDFLELRFPSLPAPRKWPPRRILFITPVIPFPVNRGSVQRTNQVIQAMHELGHQVDIALLNHHEPDSRAKDLIQRLKKQFPGARISVSSHPEFLRKAKSPDRKRRYRSYFTTILRDFLLLDHWRIQNHYECPNNFRRAISKMLLQTEYDIIYCNYLKIAPSDIGHKAIFTIADLHDIQTNRITNDVTPSWPRLFRGILLNIYRRSEKKLMNQFDQLVAISDVEREEIQQHYAPHKRIEVLPVTFFDDTAPKSDLQSKIDILFVGSESDANVASVIWFLDEIWPRILARYSTCRCLLQGTITRNEDLKSQLEAKSGAVTGIELGAYVEDLAIVYQNARIVICPTTRGTGMKVKVIEAMRHGKAIVGTSIAFEGIEAHNGVHAMIADDADSFADNVIELLNNEALRDRTRRNGLELFHKEHSFKKAVSILKKIL